MHYIIVNLMPATADICKWMLIYVSNNLNDMAKTIETVFKEIGKRIVDERKRQDMSRERLATLSKVDRSHMGFIEQGRRRPTLSTLHKICKALNISLEQLFKGL